MKSVSKKNVLASFILLLLVFITQQIQAQEVDILLSRIGQYEEDSIVFKTELVVLQNGRTRYKVFKGKSLEDDFETTLSSKQMEELQETLSYTKLRHLKRQYRCSNSSDAEKYMYTFNTKRWQTKTLVIGGCSNPYLKEVDLFIDELSNNQLVQY